MENEVLDTPGSMGGNQPLPNATAVLVLGIISIVTCWCYGVVGLACGIIAIVLAKKDRTMFYANQGTYSLASFKNMNAGRICAIVGVCLSALYLVIIICYLAFFATVLTAFPWEEIFKGK